MNGQRKCDVSKQWTIIQPGKGVYPDTCSNMDEPQKHYAKSKKPDTGRR